MINRDRKILVISKVNEKQLHEIKKNLGCLTDSETIRSIIRNTAERIKND